MCKYCPSIFDEEHMNEWLQKEKRNMHGYFLLSFMPIIILMRSFTLFYVFMAIMMTINVKLMLMVC